jgi:hypothetical protein
MSTARHWTEDELLAHLYGIGPEDGHIESCAECASRLRVMEETRSLHEGAAADSIEPGFDFLAAQRRNIYQRIAKPRHSLLWRFGPALTASLVLVLGLAIVDSQRQSQKVNAPALTDTQLVEYVGSAAMDPEPAPVAPIEGLFQE